MQGILKSNHERLCGCLQEMKGKEWEQSRLGELEEHIKLLFVSYQEKMKELKRLILAYEEKEKTIKNEIKKIKKRSNLPEPKKTNKSAMAKVLVLIFWGMQQVFIVMVSETDLGSVFQL